MRYLLAIFLFIALAAGSTKGAEFDASLLPLCQQLAETPADKLLRHELWHIAFRSKHLEHAESYEAAGGPLRKLAHVLLNEGVGHYYSFQRRVEPSITYENWTERTGNLFSLL